MRITIICSVMAVAALGCTPDEKAPEHTTREPVSTASPAIPSPPSTAQTTPEPAGAVPKVTVGGLGTFRPANEVTATVSRIVGMADTNGDGELSTPEATNLANFLIGGFFFRADTNNDGTVTPEEGREARGEFVQEYPAAARLLMRASSATGAAPFTKLAEVIDPAYGKPLTIAEARSAAQSAVADLFSFADANHDKKLTTAELQSAAVDGLKAAAKEAFQAADANHDGSIDESEFEAALKPSEKIAFALADTNADGKLTEAEASKAMSALASRMSAVGSLQIP